MKPHVEFICEN